MISARNKSLEKAHVIWSLSRAICHMDDLSSVDQRSYMITGHLQRAEDAEVVAHSMFNVIARHLDLGKRSQTPLHRSPALIWSIDAAGSRKGRIQSLNTLPHMHSILILPRSTDRFNVSITSGALTRGLESVAGLAKLPGHKAAIHMKPFDLWGGPKADVSSWDQYFNFVAYSTKGEVDLSTSDLCANGKATYGVLPYDSFDAEMRRTLDGDREMISCNLESPDRRFKHISRPYA